MVLVYEFSLAVLVVVVLSYVYIHMRMGWLMVNVSYHPILLTSLLPEQYFVARDVARSDQRWR